jgi:hypothetical protein
MEGECQSFQILFNFEFGDSIYNKRSVHGTIGTFPRRTSVRDMHVAFQIPYVYDYITKTCRQQAEVIQNHENENVRYTGQGEARHRK